ncbi:MAG: L-dopachrome tautomerase-related protein [Pseudomonadota bacterium]
MHTNLSRFFLILFGVLGALVLAIGLRYGGGEHFPDRSGAPELPASTLEVVANLDLPPGNIAVSASGRIFFSFHPEAKPPVNVAELVDGKPVPYPAQLPDGVQYQSVLSLRVDRQNRLWVLDNAHHGTGAPRLLAFDLATNTLVHRHDFTSDIAGIGSHLNDFQVRADGNMIYIAEASIFAKNPALVIYDVEKQTARRVLEGHDSVVADYFTPVVQGRRMLMLGIFAIRPGVDSIALSRDGEWLYFAPVTDDKLWRIRRELLDDPALDTTTLAQSVQPYFPKTMSDGITTDDAGNVYLSDADNSAIVLLTPQGQLRTLLKDDKLRWPDGFSFGPDGWLYVTCSALHQVIMKDGDFVRQHAPYQIFRFRPEVAAVAGH